MRRFPWMVDVIKQRPMSILHPYVVEVYVTRDGLEACLSLPAEGLLRAEQLSEGGKAEAGVQQIRDIRRQDKRGVQTKGPAGIRHGGEGVREDALALFGGVRLVWVWFFKSYKILFCLSLIRRFT